MAHIRQSRPDSGLGFHFGEGRCAGQPDHDRPSLPHKRPIFKVAGIFKLTYTDPFVRSNRGRDTRRAVGSWSHYVGFGEGRGAGQPHHDRPRLRVVKSPCLGPGFALALAGIRRRVVQIKAIEKDDLIPLWGQAVPR